MSRDTATPTEQRVGFGESRAPFFVIGAEEEGDGEGVRYAEAGRGMREPGMQGAERATNGDVSEGRRGM